MLGRRTLGVALGLTALIGGLAPAAHAQEPARFAVPLDHATPQGAQIELSMVRYAASGPRRGTVVFLAGGPGEAATPLASQIVRGPLRALRARYDLVFVDQRGTGRSTPLRCATAPRGVFRTPADATQAQRTAAVKRCADELGERRRFFSTYETVLDLEEVRQRLGVEKIIPLGVSYGGQVAGEYARRYPDRVAALILDSTSPIEGADPLDRLQQLALPRVLREVCFPPGCTRVLGDPQALLRGAVARLTRGPVRGRVVLPSGRTTTGAVALGDVYSLLLVSDTDPALRTALPAALEAIARGDAAPVLRLLASQGTGGGDEEAETGLNEVRFLATTCIEGPLPWEPESDPASRPPLLAEALRANAERYAPFPIEAIAEQVSAAQCLGWTATERSPFPPSPQRGPDVPVLVLGGREDLRTPLEDQRRAALQFPRARVVAVPNAGHATLSSDTTGCAAQAIRVFLAGMPLGRCVRRERDVPLALPVFQSLADVPGAAGTAPRRVERTAVAVDLTLRDVARQLAGVAFGSTGSTGATRSALRVGGLRGGVLELRRTAIVLRSYEIVRGVRLTGRLNLRGVGTLRITGSGATGSARIAASGAFTATLDGTAIRYRPRPVG